jgi:hypothetical protein
VKQAVQRGILVKAIVAMTTPAGVRERVYFFRNTLTLYAVCIGVFVMA